jgi:hypothetical protein
VVKNPFGRGPFFGLIRVTAGFSGFFGNRREPVAEQGV